MEIISSKKPVLILAATLLLLPIPLRQASAESYWLRGGLIGAGAGAATGGILGFMGCEALREEPTNDLGRCKAAAIPLGIVIIGAAGFGIGAGIGSLFKRNQPTVNLMMNPESGTYGATFTKPF